MQRLYSLTHAIIRNGVRDRKGPGVFTTRALADAHWDNIRAKPGFRDPRGTPSFSEIEIGKAYLPYGYDQVPTEIVTLPNLCGTAIGTEVFQLYNISTRNEPEFDDDWALLGMFATEADAEAMAQALKDRFPPFERRFEIHFKVLDRPEWTEGFGAA